MRAPAVIVGLVLTASLCACGPVTSAAQVVRAGLALGAAETAGAKQNAPYEYTAASEYLRKAREEAAYSDYSASITFADKALKYAEDAKNKALAVSQTGQPVSLPPPAPSAPPR